MTEREWLEIGRKNGVIEYAIDNPCSFGDAYKKWFRMKMGTIRPQSLDRIEVTYNRYYRGTDIETADVSAIDTVYVSDYLNKLLLGQGSVSSKEWKRIYQIISNVLEYASDLDLGAPCQVNWNVVRRYIPNGCIKDSSVREYAVPDDTVVKLYHDVVEDKIYYRKQSACLCLVLNFFLALRVGELAALRWSDIDYDRRVIRVRRTETKCYVRDNDGARIGQMVYMVRDDVKTLHSLREVPLADIAMRIIAELRAHHDAMGYESEYLAYDGHDSGVLVRSLDRTLRRLCKLSGVTYFNTHMIRKTYASKLHNGGMPTKVITDIVGHADMSTTESIYILSYQDNWCDVISRLNRIFGVDY